MKFINKNEFKLSHYKISAKELNTHKTENPKPVILDIRDGEISITGTVDGAHTLPHDQLEDRMIQLPPFGKIILFSNQQNQYIEESLRLLWENGFTELYYVDGGYEAIADSLIDFDPSAINAYIGFKEHNNCQGIFIHTKGIEFAIQPYIQGNTEGEVVELKKLDEKVSIYFYRAKWKRLGGLKIFAESGELKLDHPLLHLPQSDVPVSDRIQKLIDEQINPSIASHGGFITLIDVNDDTLYIEMGGGCQGCGMSKVTLKHGIETIIKDNIPEIEFIYDTTDHASGMNPYYQPE